MKFLQAIVDNSTSVLAWLTALFGLLVLLDAISLDETQISGVMVFAGATLGLLAAILTTAKRTVVTQVDSSGVIRAGQGSSVPTGQATPVTVNEDGSLTPQVAASKDLAKAGE